MEQAICLQSKNPRFSGSAPIRRSVERILPGLRPEDIRGVKMEAVWLALDAGAAFGGVDVFLEIDQRTARVSAVAVGFP